MGTIELNADFSESKVRAKYERNVRNSKLRVRKRSSYSSEHLGLALKLFLLCSSISTGICY